MKAFEKSYKDRIKGEYENIDYLAWRIGRYTINGIATAFDSRRNKYPDKPDSLRPPPEVEELERIHRYMMNHARYMREKKRSKEVKKNG